MNRDLQGARQAYENRDIEMSRQAHNHISENKVGEDKSLTNHEQHATGGEFIKSAVFGGNDGIITTYSVVMGALGANLSLEVVLQIGISSLIGDALSMAIGDYLSSKGEMEYAIHEKQREEWEVQNNLEGEKKEMIEIYVEKGMALDDATRMTEAISKNKKAFVDIMMIEELGLGAGDDSPFKNALVTFFSFLLFGLMPLLPFIVGAAAHTDQGLFVASTIMTAVFMFLLGVGKSIFSVMRWYLAGAETLILGATAAVVSYLIGLAFDGIE